jgi:hypothetical protein
MQPFENFQKHFFFKHSNHRKVNCVAYFVVLRREPIKWAHCTCMQGDSEISLGKKCGVSLTQNNSA